MSRERLEEYKKRLWDIAEGLASYSGVKLSDKEKEIVNYFIEQAERVRELERQVSRYKARLEAIANYINTQNELDCYKEKGEE